MREVCEVVLTDKEQPKEYLTRRAVALRIMGDAFKSVKAEPIDSI